MEHPNIPSSEFITVQQMIELLVDTDLEKILSLYCFHATNLFSPKL